MTAIPFNPFVTYTDSSGNPLVGGKIFTYAAGTSAPLASYTDASGATPATNPIILDSNGRSPYGAIWGSGTYKFVLADSTGAVIQTDDNITAAFGAGDMTKAIYDAANISQQVVGTTAVQTVTNKKFQDSTTTFIDESDSTKIAQFQCSTISTGTTRTYTFPDASGTLALAGGGTFSLSYTSTDQTITSGGLLTLAHSLGASPKFVYLELICQTGELGYTAGDVVRFSPYNDSNLACKYDSTNVYIRYGSNINALGGINYTTGGSANFTNANWRLRVKAWA